VAIFQFLLDLIFPKFCLGCQKEGVWLCRSCQREILLVKTQVCPECGRVSEYGEYCSKDRFIKPKGTKSKKARALAGIITAAYYEEGPVKELIHNFKYNHILELKDILGGLMAKTLKDNLDIANGILITAVPLHFLRRAQRGYNQSELLAEYVADKMNERQPKAGQPRVEKNFKIIKKIRRTKPQIKFSGKKRRENLKNSFKISRRTRFSVFGRKLKLGLRYPFVEQDLSCVSLKGKTIVLVDDVTTTGTTLNECAKVLREAGAKRVWGLVVAKG